MRSFSHWSPRYLLNRSIEKIYRFSNPNLPWLTPQANSILATWLLPQDRGLEFGSGRSTLWFCQRIACLFSVEHDAEWYKIVTEKLGALKIDNVAYHLVSKDEKGIAHPAYVEVAEHLEEESLDFVLVDGIFRDDCTALAMRKLRPGGLLVIDNANHYLPSNSISPNSIPLEHTPASPVWASVYMTLKTWRLIWTGNGVSDTAFFFKP
ncbi:MAG: hypothetical protein IT308_06330 [Anaerolineaceae bacterium]|nr:hypothetical protein [Anaerolineaceae bacterium]